MLERRFGSQPRILNQLHRIRLARATSQTNQHELAALSRFAAGARTALEIGSYQGVSAGMIAEAIVSDGTLYCVDPWPELDGRPNPCWLICERHLRRRGVFERIAILRGLSSEVQHLIPAGLDFAFIDGDHSWAGIETDWRIVSRCLAVGGIACVHDAIVPIEEPWRRPDSVSFYSEIIAGDARFEVVEAVHSLAVLRKVQATRP